MAKVTQVDFVPKEMVSYSKETQTPSQAAGHTDQKAGNSRRAGTAAGSRLRLSCRVVVADEEEEEDVAAAAPVEGAQEETEEQGEQQAEGKDANTGPRKNDPSVMEEKMSFAALGRCSVYRLSQGAHRGGEAAGAALGRLSDFLRARQQDCGASSGRAGGRLL